MNKKIIITGVLIIIIIFTILINVQYNKAVETCVNGGQSREICERGLR